MPRRTPPPGFLSLDQPSPPTPTIDLDAAVAEINRIYITGGLKTTVALGHYILDTFFDGNPETYHSKSENLPSFRALYKRNDLAVSRTLLGQSVNVALQVEQLPREIATRLNVTQHKALLPIKDHDVKLEFAQATLEEGLSGTAIQRRIWDRFGSDATRPGGSPMSPPAKAIRLLERGTRALGREVRPGQAWERLSDDERRSLAQLLDNVIQRLTRLHGKVDPDREDD
jgi:hypothetical protein